MGERGCERRKAESFENKTRENCLLQEMLEDKDPGHVEGTI